MIQNFFSHQSPWVILLFFGLGPIFLIYIFNTIFKKLFKTVEISENDDDFLLSALGGLITLACITIGFAYSIAITNLNQADSDLFREATKIVNLNRLLTVEGSPNALAAKKYLDLYGDSIVKDEWPEIIKGGFSQQTTILVKKMQETINKIDPVTMKQQSLFSQIMIESQHVQEARLQRILNTSMTIPSVFLRLTTLLILLIFIVSSILLINGSRVRRFALILQSCVFSLFEAGIVLLDGPYSGIMPITPDSIIKALVSFY